MSDPRGETAETPQSAAPARHRGGRQSRQAQRDRAVPIIAGVRRRIPTYELLTEEGL
jgi:trimethylamine:corrinoid methyltransferase-like protein